MGNRRKHAFSQLAQSQSRLLPFLTEDPLGSDRIQSILSDLKLDGVARLVYIAMLGLADEAGQVRIPMSAIALRAGLSLRQLQRYRAELEKQGEIRVLPVGGGGVNTIEIVRLARCS